MGCIAPGCSIEKVMGLGLCPKHYYRQRRRGTLLTRNEQTLEDLLASDTDDCVYWPGWKTDGYVRLRFGGQHQRVTRLILERTEGPARGRLALHSCDNPPCCNPRHLRWGTHADNAEDAESRGRGNHPQGTRHHAAKLDVIRVVQIRMDTGTTRDIARRFGISQPTASAIRAGSTWRSLC